MKRREFSAQALAAASMVGASAALPLSATAQARRFDNGTDYMTLDKHAGSEAPPGKIELVEFFWYSCPHCNAFEPQLEAWLKNLPKDVAFRRAPVAFRDDFVPQQRLYYALEAMGKADAMQKTVFAAIHVQKQALNTQDTIVAWVEKQGLDKAKFLDLYNSFAVSTKARKATQLQNAYKIDGVPSLGIAGAFYTDGTMAKTMERALQVTDYLISEARKIKS